MFEIFQDPWSQLVLWGAGLAIATAVALYVLGKIRPQPAQHEPVAHELMSKLRDLHAQGGLSDEEFRTIKTTLAPRLEGELKDNGQTG